MHHERHSTHCYSGSINPLAGKTLKKISNTSTIKITGSNGFITTETINLFKKI